MALFLNEQEVVQLLPPSDQSIPLFESMGVALEDIAAAQLVHRKARERGIGQELPF